MIKLMYIVGISRTDTPIFNTGTAQQKWFNDNAENVRSVDTIFPPYYTNSIRLSDDDIEFDSTYNYLILTFRNINYYYFIKDFHYVNEGLIDINIEMDTFQTFMFNINYHNARIRRRSIKRYTDNTYTVINRNYIRENYNSNQFINKTYTNYTTLSKLLTGFNGFIIIKSIEQFQVGIEDGFKKCEMISNNRVVSENVRIALLPGLAYGEFTDKDNNVLNHKHQFIGTDNTIIEYTDAEINNKLYDWQRDNKIVDMFYIPFNPFDKVYITTEKASDLYNRIVKYTGFTIDNNFTVLSLDTKVFVMARANVSPKYYNITLPYTSHTNELGTPFNSDYVPQLIDENYVDITYGERLTNTSLPLSKITHNTLYLYYQCDIIHGTRFYWIVDEKDGLDVYNTKIVVSTREEVSMYNDYFKQYVNGNIGSLFIGNTLGAIVDTLKGTPLSAVENIAGQSTELINKYFEPTSLARDSNMSTNLLSRNSDMIYTLDVATNIDAVATIYESIGYLVDEFVIGSPLFKDRQIYNYVECEEIDLSLMNAISSDELVNDIRTRFMDGMRLWNTDTMKTLNDNDKPIQLGDVCKYDNIEVW